MEQNWLKNVERVNRPHPWIRTSCSAFAAPGWLIGPCVLCSPSGPCVSVDLSGHFSMSFRPFPNPVLPIDSADPVDLSISLSLLPRFLLVIANQLQSRISVFRGIFVVDWVMAPHCVRVRNSRRSTEFGEIFAGGTKIGLRQKSAVSLVYVDTSREEKRAK